MARMLPREEDSTCSRNEQICQGVKCKGLDTALYKTYLYLYMSGLEEVDLKNIISINIINLLMETVVGVHERTLCSPLGRALS